MYRMYNCTFEELKNDKKIEPFYFQVGTELRDKFKIEELDFLTSRFESQEDFCLSLEKFKDKYVDKNKRNIIITHDWSSKIYLDEPIYNDMMILISANELTKKKKNKSNSNKRVLICNQYVQIFINQIIGYASNPDIYPYFLEPELLEGVISKDDILSLNKYIKEDFVKNGRIIKGLKPLLIEYSALNNKYIEYGRCGFLRDEIVSKSDSIEKEISYLIRSDYRNLRNLVAWENMYIEVLTRQLESTNNFNCKIKIRKQIEDIKMEKLFRNGKLDENELAKYYEDSSDELAYYEEMNNDTINSHFNDNNEIYNLYKSGEIDEVMKYKDIDEIYEDSDNYKTAVELGIVPLDKPYVRK